MSDHEKQIDQPVEEKSGLARDQPVGDKPKETTDEDFEKFKQRRMNERLQVDIDERRAVWTVGMQV